MLEGVSSPVLQAWVPAGSPAANWGVHLPRLLVCVGAAYLVFIVQGLWGGGHKRPQLLEEFSKPLLSAFFSLFPQEIPPIQAPQSK